MATRQRVTASVLRNEGLSSAFAWLTLGGCESLAGARPGQFAMLRGPWGRDPILPRAYSILAVVDGRAEFLVRRVGRGSNLLADAVPGSPVSVLGPLGTWFPAAEPGTLDLLVAGGCGLPPLYMSALLAHGRGRGADIELLLGARCSEEIVLVDRLAALGLAVFTITEDGSSGEQGLVTDLLQRRLERATTAARIFACGPEAMLRAVRQVARAHGVPCSLSLEAAMACGIGACLGCAVERAGGGYLHVCKDGPVFDAEAVWP